MPNNWIKFIIIILIILIGAVSVYFVLNREEEGSDGEEYFMIDLSNKKVAMIIAYKDFKDEEYFASRGILETAGAEIKVVSDNLGTASGADGGEAKVDIKLSDLNVSDFDAVVFIGGPGALSHLDNQDSHRIAKETVGQNKILAAICISPTILAKAGVLQGKKATVWTSPLDKGPKKILEENGVEFQDKSVVVDGNIITANGPSAAKKFGEEIVKDLSTLDINS